MKSYTDIEQSKKLAEILPLESADMNWHEMPSVELFARAFPYKHDNGATEGVFPCWSLAALLSVLPLEIETHKQTDGYKIYYYVESYMKRMEKEIYLSSERHENLVDACAEMILKLHEQNLL